MVDEVDPEVARADLSAIRDQLHCTAVVLIGTDLERMDAAAGFALEIGLDAWLEPHPVDVGRRTLVRDLTAAARVAESLRRRFPGRVVLVLGCEYSVHLGGMIPGRPEVTRLLMTVRWRHVFRRRITRVVNRLLAAALAAARPVFGGPITYASASWEDVDWSGFDFAGVNLYRSGGNAAHFEELLVERMRLAGKPLVVTEFGCGAYIGGAQRGPGSFKIVNWWPTPPRIRDGNVRNERVQAAYVGELIDVYHRHRVHAAFVYTFALREYPHVEDPLHDLDMAGFGVVKVDPEDPAKWEPKLAFHEIARRYRDLATGGPATGDPAAGGATVLRLPPPLPAAEPGRGVGGHRFHLHVELALRVNRYLVHADDGRGGPGPLVLRAEQRRGALTEELVFHGPQRHDPQLRLRPHRGHRHFGAYDVSGPGGERIGRTTEFRSSRGGSWLLEQCAGGSAEVRERTAVSALGRRLWNAVPRIGDLPFPWLYHFDVVRDGIRLATVKRTTRLRTRYLVEVRDDALDRRLVLAQAVALEAGRHR